MFIYSGVIKIGALGPTTW